MKIHDMRRSDREKKAENDRYSEPLMSGGEDYPYGLRLSLTDGELNKLGIDGTPKPGDKFRIEGEMHVTGSEQRDTDKKSDRQVHLLLVKLGAEPVAEAGERDRSIRDDLEDSMHRARGTTTPSIGARALASTAGR